MAERLLFDTDVLIDYLRDQPQAVDFIEQTDSDWLVSSITVAELFAGVRQHEEEQLLNFLQSFETVPISHTIAQKGGFYRRDYYKSYGVGLADAIIAATADQENVSLVTLNKKHYPMLANVIIPYKK